MAGGEKSIGMALLLDGRLSYMYFGSRNLQTQAVLLGKIGPPLTSLHGELRATHRQTDELTDGRGTIKAHGTSRRLRPLSVIILQVEAVESIALNVSLPAV